MRLCEGCRDLFGIDQTWNDWCKVCGRYLCDDCMQIGCCDFAPAVSGRMTDYEE